MVDTSLWYQKVPCSNSGSAESRVNLWECSLNAYPHYIQVWIAKGCSPVMRPRMLRRLEYLGELCAPLWLYRCIKKTLLFQCVTVWVTWIKKLQMITAKALYCIVKVRYKISLKFKLVTNQRIHITGSFVKTISINQTTLRILANVKTQEPPGMFIMEIGYFRLPRPRLRCNRGYPILACLYPQMGLIQTV